MDDRSSSVGILVIGLILGWMGINPAAHAADAYQPDPKLVEAAKKEGQVLLYTTQIVDQIVRPLIKSFQSYVPGVDVKYVRADGLALTVRMTNEARAGRVAMGQRAAFTLDGATNGVWTESRVSEVSRLDPARSLRPE